MKLRDAAIAEYQASLNAREGEARAVLAGVLEPETAAGLTVADIDVTDTYARYVFTDGDLNLAVVLRKSGNEVFLVSGSVGEWTELATITSLIQLGKVLPGLAPPPPPPSGPDAWAPGVAYTTDPKVSLVTYAGKAYECITGHTSQVGWEPSGVPALWKVSP